jgi:5'-nucleotidase
MGSSRILARNLACSGRVCAVIGKSTSMIFMFLDSRFPVISGFRISWDSRRPAGERVLGVWLLNEVTDDETMAGDLTQGYRDKEEIKRVEGGRKFKILTREYMAQGHDGFLPFEGQKYLIDDESGQLMSSIVRKYLLGGHC